MKSSKSDKFRIMITILLLLLSIFTNVYSIRQLSKYGLNLIFYDKMSVACQIGGLPGIKSELGNVILQSKMPREVALARVFEQELAGWGEPCASLKNKTEDLREKIVLYRNLRDIAAVLIFLILILRLIINRHNKRANKKK